MNLSYCGSALLDLATWISAFGAGLVIFTPALRWSVNALAIASFFRRVFRFAIGFLSVGEAYTCATLHTFRAPLGKKIHLII
jgi:hypothetical protein